MRQFNPEMYQAPQAETVPLTGGLDLITDKINVNPGTLQDCLNYEVGREQGYTRCEGLLEFVGRAYHTYRDKLYTATLTIASSDYHPEPGAEYVTAKGDIIKLIKVPISTTPAYSETITFYLVRGPERFAYTLVTDFWDSAEISDVTAVTFSDVQNYIDTIDAINEELTSRAPSHLDPGEEHPGDRVPGDGSILALWELDGQIYAVRDSLRTVTIPFEGADSSFEAGVVDNLDLGKTAIVHVVTVDGAQVDYNARIEVYDLELTNDDFAGGNGAGTLSAYVETDQYSLSIWPFLLTTTITSGLGIHISTIPPGISGAGVVAAEVIGDIEVVGQEYARLWRTPKIKNMTHTAGRPEEDDRYWSLVDLGREIQFDGGEVEPQTALGEAFIDEVGGDLKDSGYVFSSEQESTSDTSIQLTWQNMSNVEADDGSVTDVEVQTSGFTPVVGSWYGTSTLTLTGLGLSLPDNTAVVGIEVEIEHKRKDSFTNWNARDSKVQLVGVSGGFNKASYSNLPDSGSAFRVDTYGGDDDTWGVTQLSRDVLNSEDFGIEIQYQVGASGTIGHIGPGVQVDYVKLKVYYYDGTSHVYFYDTSAAADVAEGDIVHYFVNDGDWDDDDAKGVMTVYDIDAPLDIIPDLEIRNAASGAGSLIAVTNSSALKATLPSSSALAEQGSKYQTIKSNFYSDESADAIYGTTGASRAFMHNGTYFVYIRTGVVEEKDKPRHVAEHNLHLALGYKSGQILTSVVGDPLNFSGVLGAAEFGFGDQITGLIPLSGNALGVFCRESVHALVGTSINNFTTQGISKSSGCIEYSLVNMGQPIYCDNRGISTVSATSNYGNFSWGRLSEVVSPWLEGRLDTDHIVVAAPVRTKNQYRVYFTDGYILTMTLFGSNEQTPMFTLQHYGSVSNIPVHVPSTIKSMVLEGGQEVILMGDAAAPVEGLIWSVDGTFGGILDRNGRDALNSSLTLNPYSAGAPHINVKYNEFVIHGKTHGAVEIDCSSGSNYLVPQAGTGTETITMGDFSGTYYEDLIPDKDSVHLPNLTDGVSLKLDTTPDMVANPEQERGHIFQAITFRPTPLSDRNRPAGPRGQR